MKTKTRVLFVCRDCGGDTPKWAGQCPACGQWNTLVQRSETPAPAAAPRRLTDFSSKVMSLADTAVLTAERRKTGIGEFDRILGGGLWPGSLVLLGGAPGIGKSTLMLQVANRLARPDF
ncbi:MAG TPA: ATPase domain-containing protein, partial [Elusimicrobiota bacterium]|nr:ATPase domain-containing protein [Elusimicrobiota bacterium]